MKIQHKSYAAYSGILIKGEREFTGVGQDHIGRATWLTSHVETGGIVGTVQSYDGAGMSAGLQHEIAVYPRDLEKQGPLIATLDRIRDQNHHHPPMVALVKAFEEQGWLLDDNGVMRHKSDGRPVKGSELRNVFTPDDGKVPESGPKYEQAVKWATLFYNVFNHPHNNNILVKLAMANLSGLTRFERDAYRAVLGVEDASVLENGKNIDNARDLAFCVYHSHSVNAPSIAKNVLIDSKPDNTPEWPKRFLKMLHDKKWGNWDRRWLKTRRYAMTLWPKELFDGPNAIMPESY